MVNHKEVDASSMHTDARGLTWSTKGMVALYLKSPDRVVGGALVDVIIVIFFYKISIKSRWVFLNSVDSMKFQWYVVITCIVTNSSPI